MLPFLFYNSLMTEARKWWHSAVRRPDGGGRAVVLGLGLMGCALLVAACGGASPGQGVAHLGKTPTTSASASPIAPNVTGVNTDGYSQALAYAKCMRKNGVPDFPDPNAQGNFVVHGGPGSDLGPGSPQFATAQTACQKLLPNGGQPSAAAQAQHLAQALKFSQCMRSHGVADFPDPTAQGGRISISIKAGPGSDLNPNSPQFQAAQNACQHILPGIRHASSSGPAAAAG